MDDISIGKILFIIILIVLIIIYILKGLFWLSVTIAFIIIYVIPIYIIIRKIYRFFKGE